MSKDTLHWKSCFIPDSHAAFLLANPTGTGRKFPDPKWHDWKTRQLNKFQSDLNVLCCVACLINHPGYYCTQHNSQAELEFFKNWTCPGRQPVLYWKKQEQLTLDFTSLRHQCFKTMLKCKPRILYAFTTE